jgi:hypothetical protein
MIGRIARRAGLELWKRQIGKAAYNARGHQALKSVRLGTIVDVRLVAAGEEIGRAEAIPEAGIPERIRRSPKDALYCVIEDGGGRFMRPCSEIVPR